MSSQGQASGVAYQGPSLSSPSLWCAFSAWPWPPKVTQQFGNSNHNFFHTQEEGPRKVNVSHWLGRSVPICADWLKPGFADPSQDKAWDCSGHLRPVGARCCGWASGQLPERREPPQGVDTQDALRAVRHWVAHSRPAHPQTRSPGPSRAHGSPSL